MTIVRTRGRAPIVGSPSERIESHTEETMHEAHNNQNEEEKTNGGPTLGEIDAYIHSKTD